MGTDKSLKGMYSTKAIASKLGISEGEVFELIRTGKLRAINVNTDFMSTPHYRITEEQLENYSKLGRS